MEKFLSRMSLRVRILTLSIIPLTIAVILSLSAALEANRQVSEAHKISELTGYSPAISAVIHELQKERGRSAGFIGSGGNSDLAALMKNQRSNTDKALSAFQSADAAFDYTHHSNAFSTRVDKAKSDLATLNSIRTQVDRLSFTVPEMAQYYTTTIANLLNIIKEMALLSSDANLSRQVTTFVSLLEAKERAGLERAMGNAGYSAGTFAPAIYKRFLELIAEQRAYYSVFTTYGSDAVKDFYNKTIKGKAVDDVELMRNYAIEGQGDVSDGRYQGTFWFDRITEKINLLKQVEDFTNKQLLESATTHVANATSKFWLMVLITLMSAGIIVAFNIVVYRSIARPLRALENTMGELAEGNLDTYVPYTEYQTAIGRMAKSVNTFKETARERKQLEDETRARNEARRAQQEAMEIERKEQEIATLAREKADLEQQEKRIIIIDQLTHDFDAHIGNALTILSDAATELSATAQAMAQQAQGNEQESGAAALAAEQTNANVHTVASATEELATSISEISQQVAQSTIISSNAVTETERASQIVSHLAESSQKVGDVVKLINDIAEQTNLLALNATIEAARAGDAGKGFAVVAHEVKALADQTAKATGDIAEQVRNIQQVSNDVTHVVTSIRTIIEQMSGIAATVAAAVEEQGAATGEISRNVQEANTGTEKVSGRVAVVRTLAKETRASSNEVEEAARKINACNEKLEAVVSAFLSDVKLAQQSGNAVKQAAQ